MLYSERKNFSFINKYMLRNWYHEIYSGYQIIISNKAPITSM